MEELIDLKDRKDKLSSKIYMKKVEELMESSDLTNIYRCIYCNELFTND